MEDENRLLQGLAADQATTQQLSDTSHRDTILSNEEVCKTLEKERDLYKDRYFLLVQWMQSKLGIDLSGMP